MFGLTFMPCFNERTLPLKSFAEIKTKEQTHGRKKNIYVLSLLGIRKKSGSEHCLSKSDWSIS